MNFLGAYQHALIGYGIKRKIWANCLCTSDQYPQELVWHKDIESSSNKRPVARLLGPDKTYDLQPEDIVATDWETV